jgi:prepilin-type N-terminal cleavage/methylation domain-containing protein
MHKYRYQREGFTIIELLIVITIITIISAVGMGSFLQTLAKQRFKADVVKIESLLYLARSKALNTEKCVGGAAIGYRVTLSNNEMKLECMISSTEGTEVFSQRLDNGTDITFIQNASQTSLVYSAQNPDFITPDLVSPVEISLENRAVELSKTITVNKFGVVSVQ